MIELERVTKRYGDAAVVNDVSLGVAEGAMLAVVGASGSGKTTLLRMINRLVEPTAGQIRLAGQDCGRLEPHRLRRGIGYAIQGDGLFPHWTVAANIATTPRLLGWDSRRVAARIDELLALFGLDPRAYGPRYPHELSGGERQRVGVARALAAEPRVLLMDEPFGALDPVIRAKAQADLRDVQRRLGVTVVLVTHDMTEAMRLGDRIAVMERGRVVQHAPPVEILAWPATPFVAELIGDADRPFHRLALGATRELVEPGAADGEPIRAESDGREALAALLWSGREAAPVVAEDGARLGVITLRRLVRLGAMGRR